jgi:hypothetical protein
MWNHLLTTPRPFLVERLEITESDAFADQVVHLDPATVLAGSHGGGKSLFLALLGAVFGAGLSSPPFVGSQRHGDPGVEWANGRVRVTVRRGDERLTRLIDLSESAEQRDGAWNGTFAVDRWTSRITAAELAGGFEFYVQEFDPNAICDHRRYTARELSAVRNILGRAYRSVTVYTLLLGGSWLAPFVIAEENGRTVTSTVMSLGELWFHQTIWEMYQVPEGSPVAIDEPESYLAVKGQRPFIDEIAQQSLRNRSQLIVATHSPDVLSRFPIANTRMCIRDTADGKVRIVQPASPGEVHSAVGMRVDLRTIVLVEDDFAATVLREILGSVSADAAGIEIVPAGGKDRAIAAAEVLRRTDRLRCFAVLDADQRARCDGRTVHALPGDSDPERELLRHATECPEAVAAALGRPADTIRSALVACEFVDHQYQLATFARHVGVDLAFATAMLIRGWLPRVAGQAAALADTIAA